jgi:hypothetical protein
MTFSNARYIERRPLSLAFSAQTLDYTRPEKLGNEVKQHKQSFYVFS